MSAEAAAHELLLVEDNPGDVRLTREALAESGMGTRLWLARDGVEALHFLRRDGAFADAPRPGLVVLDLNLPRKDGREVLGEIRGDPALQCIPVVVFTSSQAERDIADAYRLGANGYVAKPAELDRYLAVVRAIEAFWFGVARLPGGAR